MIFVDTNVLMYAVGRSHPLREEARTFLKGAIGSRAMQLCTSAEVLQELLHAYIPVGRMQTLDAALELAGSCIPTVWPVEESDVRLARLLADRHPQLRARDLLHVSMCRRRNVERIRTFDRTLAAAFPAGKQ